MPGLRVDADHVGVLQLIDERQGVPDGGQQDVAARLIRLRLDRKPQSVAAIDRILGQRVHRLPVPI
jgi:hypothetical protein